MAIKRGEIYKVNLDPTVGSEMKKTRPALVVSADSINKASSVVIVCPITGSQGKSSPIHVELPAGEAGLTKDSVVHCGQVRSVDAQRLGERLGELDRQTMAKVGKGLRDAMSLW